MSMNYLEEKFQRFDTSIAIVCDGNEYSYKVLYEQIEAYKQQINQRINKDGIF